MSQDSTFALVAPTQVFMDVEAQDPYKALKFIATKAHEIGLTNSADAVYDAFCAREDQGTTGMMDGFAIPHAKSVAVQEPCVMVCRFAHPLEWKTMDDSLVSCAIALMIPADEGSTTHLKLLSKIAVLLMDEGFRATLHGATSAEQIASALNAGLSEA